MSDVYANKKKAARLASTIAHGELVFVWATPTGGVGVLSFPVESGEDNGLCRHPRLESPSAY